MYKFCPIFQINVEIIIASENQFELNGTAARVLGRASHSWTVGWLAISAVLIIGPIKRILSQLLIKKVASTGLD